MQLKSAAETILSALKQSLQICCTHEFGIYLHQLFKYCGPQHNYNLAENIFDVLNNLISIVALSTALFLSLALGFVYFENIYWRLNLSEILSRYLVITKTIFLYD